MLLYCALAAAAGSLLVGVLGTGAALLLLPTLALTLQNRFAGLAAPDELLRVAAGTALATMAVGAVAAAFAQRRAGHVDAALLRRCVLPYLAGALLGPWLSRLLSADTLRVYVALLLALVALRFLLRPAAGATAGPGRGNVDFYRHPRRNALALFAISLFASVAGVASGLFAIPYLRRFRLPLKTVIGTSTAAAAVYASAGAAGYIGAGLAAPPLPWSAGYVYLPAFAVMAAVAAAGAPLGVRLAGRVDAARLARLFGALVLAAAAALLLTR